MDLLFYLGIFPFTFNLYTLLGYKFENNDSHRIFIITASLISIVWLFLGFFSDQWKIFLIMFILNVFVLSRFKHRLIIMLRSLIIMLVVVVVNLIKVKLLVWDI